VEPQSEKPSNSVALVAALNHWMRRAILRWINDEQTKYCATDLEDLMDLALSNISYHMRFMDRAGLLKLADTKRVRGATAYYYVSAVTENQIVQMVLKETEDEDVWLEIKARKRRVKRKRKPRQKAQ
jgi:DNA-binding transcriptional ArsR family regulator